MRNANGRSAAKVPLTAIPLHAPILKAAVTSMHRVGVRATACNKQLNDSKKSFSKTNPYYNKQQTMKVTNGALAALFALTLGACSNVDFKKTKGGMPYKVFAGKGGQK